MRRGSAPRCCGFTGTVRAMGDRNREQGGAGPRRSVRVLSEMAPDVAMPITYPDLPNEHPQHHLYRRRVLERYLHGVRFLLTYIAFVEDSGFDVPAEQLAPQREDEPDEQYQQRHDLARLATEAQAAAGRFAEMAVDEARHIRPSDAGAVAMWMSSKGREWSMEPGFVPTAHVPRDRAIPLLHAMCPPVHLPRALEMLDMFWWEFVDQCPPSVEETAAEYPITTLHVTAAMTASWYSEPACVPDRGPTRTTLIAFNEELLARLYPPATP